MPATGPEITRRLFLFAAVTPLLRADSADDVWAVLSEMASGLSAGSVTRFFAAFDPAMPELEDFRVKVTALLGVADVQSSIELVSNEGDDSARTVETDWLLRITGRDETSGATRRQEQVKCGFKKQGKRWRIVSLTPLAFFAPMQAK
jgi:hypothetical protein